VLLRHSSVIGVLLEWVVVGAVGFLTEPEVFESMSLGEVCVIARFELVVLECAVDVGVSKNEDSERGHATSWFESLRVFMHSWTMEGWLLFWWPLFIWPLFESS